MVIRPSLVLIVFFLLGIQANFAQNRWIDVKLSDYEKPEKCRVGKIDSISLSNVIQKCINNIHDKGFIAARVDSFSINNSNTNLFVTRGPLYRWAICKSDSLKAQGLITSPIPMARLHGKPVRPNDVSFVSNSLIAYFENRGYPFSTFSLNPLQIDSSTVIVSPSISTGPLITWDTLIVKGNVKIDHRYLTRYLGFKPNEPYSEALVKSTQFKINELPFVASIRKPEVEFKPHKANLYLYLNSSRASRFSGLIGFSSDGNSESKLKLTGDINLLLRNAFRKGEELSFKWNALGEGSQRLSIFASLPYIAGSAYGIEAHFKMHKQDTSYLNINPRIAIAIFSTNGFVAGLGFEVKQSRVLSVQQQLNLRDYSTYLYQFNLKNWQQTPSEFPRQGLWYDAQFGAGRQFINTVPSSKRVTVLNFQGRITWVLPIVQKFLLFKISSISDASYKFSNDNSTTNSLSNDLVRIGGSEVLRGFNQESIATDRFALGSIECHFVAQQKVSLYIFTDKAIVSQLTSNSRTHSWPQGIGIGSLLLVGNGVLKFNYALGQGFGEVFQLRNAKVHIGYTASF
jgi:outer membrane translocation and assembly module TamA